MREKERESTSVRACVCVCEREREIVNWHLGLEDEGKGTKQEQRDKRMPPSLLPPFIPSGHFDGVDGLSHDETRARRHFLFQTAEFPLIIDGRRLRTRREEEVRLP